MREEIAGPLVPIAVKSGAEVANDPIIVVENTIAIVKAGIEIREIVSRRGIPSRIGEDLQISGVIRYDSIKLRFRLVNAAPAFVIFFLVGNGLRLTKYSTNFRVISPLQQTFNQSFLCLLRDCLRMISSTQY